MGKRICCQQPLQILAWPVFLHHGVCLFAIPKNAVRPPSCGRQVEQDGSRMIVKRTA